MMKKFWTFPVGLILGAALMFGIVAYAEESKSFVGAMIEGQFPVTVDGIPIENPGIVVEKVSYLPTRVIAELGGFEVSFDAELGIKLEKKEIMEPEVQEVIQSMQVEQAEPEVDPAHRIRWIEEEIKSLQMYIVVHQATIDLPNPESAKDEARLKISEIEDQIADLESEKVALEEQMQSVPE